MVLCSIQGEPNTPIYLTLQYVVGNKRRLQGLAKEFGTSNRHLCRS